MTSPRLTQAHELVTQLTQALEPIGATATLHAGAVPSAARHGVALVTPPSIRFETFEHSESLFEVYVIAGPPTKPLTAWERLDEMIDALEQAGINLRAAEPATFTPYDASAPLHAYILKLNPTD